MLPPEFIMEINDTDNNKFMIGLTCSDHKQNLKEKFVLLQRGNHIPEGEIVFTPIKIIHTDCITGNQEDVDEIQLKRL
ncbi:MAG: hypothetical protein ABJB76_05650 [Candidatus Nitrosocosmicus sp.]